MSKSQIRQYVFTPGGAGAGTIKVPGKVDLSQLLVITNVTKNVIIYNFADVAYAGTSVSFSRANDANFTTALDNTDGVTTITLAVNTSTHSASDNIQVLFEKPYQEVRMPEIGTDAFERTRIAQPRSMLDADFEYGLQPTKWLTYELMRGYPSIYEIPGTDTSVVTVITDAANGESLITVTTTAAHGFVVGQPITIKGYLNTVTGFARAEGSFLVNTVPSSTTFTYWAKAKVGTSPGDVLSTTYTQLRAGAFYTGAAVGSPTFTYSNASSPSTITVTFAYNHGFVPGDTILASTTEPLASGPFFVETVPTATSFTYTARATGTISGTITGTIYARPDAFFVHRPFDGGVILGTGSPSHGASAVRQSKKYIRYQSGKAINYNTAALFAPNYDIRSVTSTGTTIGSTITITTDDVDHGCQVGATINLSGITTSGYNGTYTVASIVDERSLTVTATQTLGGTTAAISDPCLLSVIGWSGATVRAGTYDEQNGQFWQFDGQTVAIGKRSSTFQLAGTVAVTTDSNSITGTNTRFSSQLVAGDRIVIKGMTHVVTNIASDTQIYVTPDYRGSVSLTGVKPVKTVDYIVPQSKWNMDRCDGTGNAFNPSGYSLDVSKMQMIGLQWTWYGAGFIDWMLRGPEGKYITVHRLRNNNTNKEAYMRSGNMPVRYEVINEGPRTFLTLSATSIDTTLTVSDASFFPSTGVVYVDNELISYSGKTATTLTGCSRAVSLSQFAAGSTRAFQAAAATTHSINAGVILVKQTATPSISHWGSAFITDGGFDEDRGYIFNYQATNINISTKKTTAFAIRLAPSVSNAIVGDLGVRELINRAQLLLQSISITAGGSANVNSALVVEGILNPSNYPSNIANITWNSLNSTALQTGQPSFAQIATGTSVTFLNNFSLATTVGASGAAIGATTIPVASTAGIAVGDDVFSTTVQDAFLGGTKVLSFVTNTSVTVTNPLVKALSNTNNLTISRSTYALPGETVFSFLNSPNGTDKLDLDQLKELTNTPIGGRGTFPNGPDVLFINVYLTQGAPINSNLVLRWGEAQA